MSLIVRVLEQSGPTTKISVIGRLDSTTSILFDARVDELLLGPVGDLVVDLGDLEYISSAGLGALFRAKKEVEARRGRFILMNPRPGVKKVFEIVKVLPELAIFSSTEELDRYLDAMQRRASDS